MSDIFFTLIAKSNYFKSIKNAASGSGAFSSSMTLIAVVVLFIFAWAGLYYWEKHRTSDGRTGKPEDDLFFDLCKGHQMKRKDRQLLLKAAKAFGLKHPEFVFIDPSLLSRISMSGSQYAADCERLRYDLFDEEELQP